MFAHGSILCEILGQRLTVTLYLGTEHVVIFDDMTGSDLIDKTCL